MHETDVLKKLLTIADHCVNVNTFEPLKLKNRRISDLISVIQLYKIDSIWGLYSTEFEVRYNDALNKKFNIRVPRGHHKFYFAVCPPMTHKGTFILATNLASDKMQYADPGVSRSVICLSADIEAGIKYGLAYKMCFGSPTVSSDYYYEIKIVKAEVR
jgi:hypothetical protein